MGEMADYYWNIEEEAAAQEALRIRAEQQEAERHIAERLWRTKEGQEIPVSKMTDSHLLNTIRFLKRNGYAHDDILDSYLGAGPTADAAMEAYEREQMQVFDDFFSGRLKPSLWVNILEEEAKKRGLEVCR